MKSLQIFLNLPDSQAVIARILVLPQGELNETALSFRRDQEAKRLASATINQRLSFMRSICKAARRIGVMTTSIEIENVRGDTRAMDGPDCGRILDVLEYLNVEALKHRAFRRLRFFRDRAMISLCFYAALRRSEVTSIERKDVYMHGKVVLHIHGKGQRRTIAVELSQTCAQHLRDYLQYRGGQHGPLFWSATKTQVCPKWFYRRVKQLGLFRPHGLRHTAITEALQVCDIREVQQFARHSSIKTTTVYDDRRRYYPMKVALKLDEAMKLKASI